MEISYGCLVTYKTHTAVVTTEANKTNNYIKTNIHTYNNWSTLVVLVTLVVLTYVTFEECIVKFKVRDKCQPC